MQTIKLKKENYCYAYVKDKKWILSNEEYPRAKVLLDKKYIDDLVKNLKNKKSSDKESSDEESSDKESSDEESSDEESSDKESDIKKAPPVLLLKDHEKFTDSDGYMLNIEVRGTRKSDNCFFKVADISKEFDLPSLNKVLLNTSNYVENLDYCLFFVLFIKDEQGKNKKISRNLLYLTYDGLIHVLFASHSKSAHKFRNWATKKLFTLHLGTEEQKVKLCSKALGVSIDSIKTIFNLSVTKIPCVYFCIIGTVKDLRKSMNIPKNYKDEAIVSKYGRTDDLPRRCGEHEKTYGEIKGSNLSLKYFAYVNISSTSTAEASIAEYFKSLKLNFEYKNHEELVICDIKKLNKEIKNKYFEVGNAYGADVIALNQTVEILRRDCEMFKKDTQLALKDNEILKKDNEILKLKLEINKKNYNSDSDD